MRGWGERAGKIFISSPTDAGVGKEIYKGTLKLLVSLKVKLLSHVRLFVTP